MKRTLFMVAVVTGIIFAFNSCKKKETDPCDGVSCQKGGTCLFGVCDCPTFISGPNCETEDRQGYYGTYSGTLTIDFSSNVAQTVTLSEYPGNYGRVKWGSQYLSIQSTAAFEIKEQDFGGPGVTVSGSGTRIGKDLTMSYTVTNGSTETYYYFTGSK